GPSRHGQNLDESVLRVVSVVPLIVDMVRPEAKPKAADTDPTLADVPFGILHDDVVDGLVPRRHQEIGVGPLSKPAVVLGEDAIAILRGPFFEQPVGPAELPEYRGKHETGDDEEGDRIKGDHREPYRLSASSRSIRTPGV